MTFSRSLPGEGHSWGMVSPWPEVTAGKKAFNQTGVNLPVKFKFILKNDTKAHYDGAFFFNPGKKTAQQHYHYKTK